MSIYNDMLNMGLTEDCKMYSGERVDYSGKIVPALMVDISYKGNTITLVSDQAYTEDLRSLAFALERTFLHSVNLRQKPNSLSLMTSNLFSKNTDTAVAAVGKVTKYFAEQNVLYLPEGIYRCEKDWSNDEELYLSVSKLTRNIRTLGMHDKYQQELDSLGAVKIIDFSEYVDKQKLKPLYTELLDKGATVVSELKFHRGRPKAYGDMYDGSASLELEGITYFFKMWYHHSSETHMTEEEVIEHLGLSSVSAYPSLLEEFFPEYDLEGRNSFDCNWSTLRYGNTVFLHPLGWFSSRNPNAKELEKATDDLGYKLKIYGLTKDLISEAEGLGFKRII